MSEYCAKVVWNRADDENFTDDKYSRDHQWLFDGGISFTASASPSVIPAPYVSESSVDPEEAFVASLSSCHMLFFLAFAAKKQFVVDDYTDNAVGVLGKNSEGKISMTRITLRPQVSFSGLCMPSEEQIQLLHDKAHQHCYIANSVRSEVVIEAQLF